uniref:Uncharacterized protein n=1 Tax=Anguilla anguilla TaxID=7936 RepID=A0A0E9QMW1_ANGAN
MSSRESREHLYAQSQERLTDLESRATDLHVRTRGDGGSHTPLN